MNKIWIRWLLGVCVFVSPLAELAFAYYKSSQSMSLGARQFIVAFMLMFTGWSLISNRPWARKLGLAVILTITISHFILSFISSHINLLQIIPGAFVNLIVAFILYKDEFGFEIAGLHRPWLGSGQPSWLSVLGHRNVRNHSTRKQSVKLPRTVSFPTLKLQGDIQEPDETGFWIRWTKGIPEQLENQREIIMRFSGQKIHLVFQMQYEARSRFNYINLN